MPQGPEEYKPGTLLPLRNIQGQYMSPYASHAKSLSPYLTRLPPAQHRSGGLITGSMRHSEESGSHHQCSRTMPRSKVLIWQAMV